MVAYLTTADAVTYGVSEATDAQINAASRMVDLLTKRPEGLVWTPDTTGAPCYMAGLQPTLTLSLVADIAPGVSVVAPMANAGLARVGDILIADRADPTKAEALVVSYVGSGSVTFASVARAHAADATLDAGMAIEETAHPSRDGRATLYRSPVTRALSATLRDGLGAETLADVSVVGRSAVSVAPLLPFGGLHRPAFHAMTVRYLAGFPATGLPPMVKQATANLIKIALSAPELVGNLKSIRAGDTAMERFSASSVDVETMQMLAPYACAAFA